MKYIGNKTRLLPFIEQVVENCGLPTTGTFMDPFAGTASVSVRFKELGYKIISADIMTYSYLRQRALIELDGDPQMEGVMSLIRASSSRESNVSAVLAHLNQLEGRYGYAFENFAPSGSHKRQYFTDINAMKIDAIRDEIQVWRDEEVISDLEFAYLVSALIESSDHVANMSGTYGAYLKIWRSVALKELNLKPFAIVKSRLQNFAHLCSANDLVRKESGTILYLDPPYNSRQYASNFHVLESIAVWDKQQLRGKTGLRNYDNQRSEYSTKTRAKEAFADLISNSEFDYILLSYSNEGILSEDYILDELSKHGSVQRFEKDYKRFRTERNHASRNYADVGDRVSEYLYVLKKN